MANQTTKKTLVVGHRNPDTDSICSAICYANLKHQLTGQDYEPCRVGSVNAESEFVLDYFNVDAPRLIDNVKTQVKDIDFRKTVGAERGNGNNIPRYSTGNNPAAIVVGMVADKLTPAGRGE